MNHERFHRRHRALMVLFFVGVVALLTLAVWLLWNGILPEVLGVKALTYWQALGVLVLAKILFGGFPGRGHNHFGRFMMRKRWAAMTPEERAELQADMRRRFGDWPRPPWHDTPDVPPQDKAGNP